MKPSTLIVGYGITGKNLHREIAALNPDIWNSHCLNKDVATIADNPKAYLLRQIINFNNQCKKSLQS